MFVIFLDIDGVLATEQSYFYWGNKKREVKNAQHFCPIATSNINYLCKSVPDLHIVISSAWRTYFSFEQLQSFLIEDGFLYSERVLGVTPMISRRSSRYVEITSWLDANAVVEDWVAIDDHAFNIPASNLCLTKQEVGFTITQAYDLIQRFNPDWLQPIFIM